MASKPEAELISLLERAVDVLRTSGQKRWAAWLEKDRKLIADGDFHGVEHVLQAFGGMGSLNDVLLASESQDAELKRLTSRIYEIANALRRGRDRREAI